MGILANENSISAGGYTIERSLRFQSASSQYLSRTFASAGSLTTWTWSGWVKRGALSSFQRIFSTTANASQFYLRFNNTDTLLCETASSAVVFNTTQVFRDPSSWYHIVFTWDTTNATASDRVRLYVNGTRVTAFATINNPTLNATSSFNTAAAHYIGSALTTEPVDGYMAEVNFIDGQALTPSSFGETDALTGVWVAKRYTGTYGTNGFYLPFSNGTSTTTLGQDRSGNANNWTLTNFTRSAGVSDCWMYDVPSGNGGASGTQPNSNYAVINPIGVSSAPVGTLTQGNLNYSAAASASYSRALGTIGVSSGKWYWEMVVNSVNRIQVGIIGINDYSLYYPGYSSVGYCYDQTTGNKVNNNTFTAYGATLTTNDIVGVAFDADAGTLTFYKNNVSQGTAFTGLSGTFVPAVGNGSSSASCSGIFNFGQRSFAYTPPSGFKALCTANLPAPTIAKGNQYMDATLYTGNGTSQSIVNAGGFSPDLVWLKARSIAEAHELQDTVRGASNLLKSNSTAAEVNATNTLTSFNSNGFSLGSSTEINTNAATYVAWQWDAGSSTVTNTSGSISSQVRANTTAGFSIVTYTGTANATDTIGHGLGVAPRMVIVKSRSAAGYNWMVYHASAGANRHGYLNLTNAFEDPAGVSVWNDTAPTSTVFTISNNANVNGSGVTFVAYCFSEIAGFSRFGSYTGNGSADGAFVYTGFRPKFVMIKCSSAAGAWSIFDAVRTPYNATIASLSANDAAAEVNVSTYGIDILSNGFKLRTADATINGSGSTYIFMAFAENPFSVSNSR